MYMYELNCIHKKISLAGGMGMTVHPPLSQLMYVHRACTAKEPSDTLPGLGLALHSFWWQTCWHIIINRFYWRAHAGASHWLKELLYFWSTASETMGPKAVAWILHRPVKPGIRLSFRAHEFRLNTASSKTKEDLPWWAQWRWWEDPMDGVDSQSVSPATPLWSALVQFPEKVHARFISLPIFHMLYIAKVGQNN